MEDGYVPEPTSVLRQTALCQCGSGSSDDCYVLPPASGLPLRLSTLLHMVREILKQGENINRIPLSAAEV